LKVNFEGREPDYAKERHGLCHLRVPQVPSA